MKSNLWDNKVYMQCSKIFNRNLYFTEIFSITVIIKKNQNNSDIYRYLNK